MFNTKCLLLAIVILGLAGLNAAYAGAPSVIGVPTATGGLNAFPKTPPLSAGGSWAFPIHVHHPGPLPHWAGYLIEVHVTDGSELNHLPSLPVNQGGTPAPSQITLPASTGTSARALGTAWGPNAQASGITQLSSTQIPVLTVRISAKGTTVGENSDVDMEVRVWNIRHLASTNTFQFLNESDWIYGAPNTNPIPNSSLPTDPPVPGSGRWYHVGPGQTKTIVHTPGVPPSLFYATLVGTVGLGIEHVPEPASGLMVLCGIGAIVMGRVRIRARR